MKCETCGTEHNGEYGSGRFCNAKCARSFATMNSRAEINEKVKHALKGRQIGGGVPGRLKGIAKTENHKEQLSIATKTFNAEHRLTSIMQLSKRTISKIVKRLNIECSRCGWKEAYGDIHHIIPKSKGGSDDHDNLTYICPNCHRLAHTIGVMDFVNLKDHIGDRWLEFYFPERESS